MVARFDMVKLIKLFVLVFVSFYSLVLSVHAESEVFATSISCYGIDSEVISECEGHSVFGCKNQRWEVEGKTVDLRVDALSEFLVVSWACFPSKNSSSIIFYHATGGNCPSCERHTIWSGDGYQISDWKFFDKVYDDMGFIIEGMGGTFHSQFHWILD